jgi:hypothetical protein
VSALATLLEAEWATDTFDVMKHYLAKVAGRFPSSYDDDDADAPHTPKTPATEFRYN